MSVKALSIVVIIAAGLAAALSGGCGIDEGDGSEGWNLEGRWEVSAIRFDDVVVEEYLVLIEEDADSVTLWRDGERVSAGRVGADTLFCTDWGGYSIRRIFIDDWRHMHSETPGCEMLKVILFERRWASYR
jgi:hypothetical protein